MLLDDGFIEDDIFHILANKNITNSRKPKYKYIDDNGAKRTWTGKGRTPNSIKDKIEQGWLLSDFEIDND